MSMDEILSFFSNLIIHIKILASGNGKKFKLALNWTVKWLELLTKEASFDPKSLKRYARGEVILVDFGFNVGSEMGGMHYAIVLDTHNTDENATITVMPMSSHKAEKKIHRHDILLGVGLIPACPTTISLGKSNQIRAISKMRIIRPRTLRDTAIATIPSNVMKNIDQKLHVVYIGGSSRNG